MSRALGRGLGRSFLALRWVCFAFGPELNWESRGRGHVLDGNTLLAFFEPPLRTLKCRLLMFPRMLVSKIWATNSSWEAIEGPVGCAASTLLPSIVLTATED